MDISTPSVMLSGLWTILGIGCFGGSVSLAKGIEVLNE
jgi:hypothetical protein